MSRVTAISALVICIIVCHELLIITVLAYSPLKPARQKCQRTEAGERGNYWQCRCVSVMLLRSMQNTRELADAKAENDALRDDVAAGRRQLHIKAVCRSVRKYHRLRRG